MTDNTKRQNVKEVDELLRQNAGLNATLGTDSTLEEINKVKWHLNRNIGKIKALCLFTYNRIKEDDNSKIQKSE
jgi:hypothetical protein